MVRRRRIVLRKLTEGLEAGLRPARAQGGQRLLFALLGQPLRHRAHGWEFEKLDHEYGRIDILGNVYGPGAMSRPEETSIAEVQYVLHGLVVAR